FNALGQAVIKGRIASGSSGQDIGQLINFIRGDRSMEGSNGFRTRGTHVLGDIVNSQPELAGGINEGWSRLPDAEGGGVEYSNYLDGGTGYGTGKGGRAEVIYVGANDGMLHGFNAENGAETMAYIPYAVQNKLGALAEPSYQHEFYVDGQIAIGDAYNGSRWRNILIGGLGAGGRAIYAIDITNPDSPSVLWELTHEDDPSIGYTFGEPVITRLQDGTWVAIFGNGYGGENGQASLQVRRLFGQGSLVDEVDLGAAGDNGLSGVAVLLDPVTQTFATRAYAGDLKGNMWRVDFNNSRAEAGFSGAPLYTVSSNRPITATPALAASPSGGVFVYFGTGRLLETGDNQSNSVERFWAVRDRNMAINQNAGFGAVTASAGGQVQGTLSNENGWYMDLSLGNGERVVNKARVIFGRLIFTSFEPDDDVCATGGDQRLYVLDAQSGSGLLDSLCTNCGVIDLGRGAPVEPPVVLKPAQPPAFTPPGPNTPPPAPPTLPPGVDPAIAREGWCSEFGILTGGVVGGFQPLGTLCDGRQVWRQPR
ncbi:MAG: PilC/PilY family type IV pilus protein, partial [Pseudomonadota bacterium]